MVAVVAAAASWEEVVVDLVVAPWEGVDGEAGGAGEGVSSNPNIVREFACRSVPM